MNLADWLILGAILLSVLSAASEGFIYEVISAAGLVVGYLVAVWWYSTPAAWFAPIVKTTALANVAGFVTIFAGTVLLAGMLARAVRSGAKLAGLHWFDRLLGAGFGFLRGMVFVMVLLLGATSWVPDSKWLAQSQFAPYLLVMARAAIWLAPSEVRAQFGVGINELRSLERTGQPGGH